MKEQIKLARLRRRLSAELVSERACISKTSLWNAKKRAPIGSAESEGNVKLISKMLN